MAQQDVLDYIRNTPHNSNVNVVKGMLDESGGVSVYYVNFTWDENYENLITDANFDDMVSAYNTGKIIIAKLSDEGENEYFYLAGSYEDTNESFYFASIPEFSPANNGNSCFCNYRNITWTKNGTIQNNSETLQIALVN